MVNSRKLYRWTGTSPFVGYGRVNFEVGASSRAELGRKLAALGVPTGPTELRVSWCRHASWPLESNNAGTAHDGVRVAYEWQRPFVSVNSADELRAWVARVTNREAPRPPVPPPVVAPALRAALDELVRAVEFMGQCRADPNSGATGGYRDAVEWIDETATKVAAAWSSMPS